MKHVKTVDVPATIRKVVDFVTCDLCKEKILEEGSYDVNEVEVHHKKGSNFGMDGGSLDDVVFDICGKCFDGKLIPWLRTQGANPCIEKSNW